MSGYISEVLSYEANLKLSSTETDFLYRIAKGACSVYKIYSELKTQTQFNANYNSVFSRIDLDRIGKAMAYKNVHRRIMKLLKLRLIKEVNPLKLPGVHGAKYYTITSKGTFYLIYFRMLLLPIKDLPQYHGNIVLDTILFPYFDDHTLKRLTTRVMSHLALYLGECCEITLREVEKIRETTDLDERQKRIDSLMNKLRWSAKSMVFRISGADDFTPHYNNKHGNERTDSDLASDKKFVGWVGEVKREFDHWYELFSSEVRKRTKGKRANQ